MRLFLIALYIFRKRFKVISTVNRL